MAQAIDGVILTGIINSSQFSDKESESDTDRSEISRFMFLSSEE